MNRLIFISLFMISMIITTKGQETSIPAWFTEDIERMEGVWIADNSAYQSENEPYKFYVQEWKKGIGNTSLVGRLAGVNDKDEEIVFWEFRQYWDNLEQKAVVIQYGNHNMMGEGNIYPVDGHKMESIQTFTLADGRKWIEKHISFVKAGVLTTTSYEQKSDGSWETKRTYKWSKEKQKVAQNGLGTFSMSLAVKDIQKSKDFYENLGFAVIDGKVEQKWVILKNGNSKIGLFQGMFPNNTMTFNPQNARAIYQQVKKQGVNIIYEMGMDKEEGPCSFSFLDPDGTPILVDQH